MDGRQVKTVDLTQLSPFLQKSKLNGIWSVHPYIYLILIYTQIKNILPMLRDYKAFSQLL